jgi:hypothetical protein
LFLTFRGGLRILTIVITNLPLTIYNQYIENFFTIQKRGEVMGWFTKKIDKFKRNIQTNDDTLGVIIHFTPIAIYLYTCDEYIETFDGTLTFETENGNQVEIGGTFISLEVDANFRMDDIIFGYKLKESNLPIVELKAYA